MLRPSRKQHATSSGHSNNGNHKSSLGSRDDTNGKSKAFFPLPVVAAMIVSAFLVGVAGQYYKARQNKGTSTGPNKSPITSGGNRHVVAGDPNNSAAAAAQEEMLRVVNLSKAEDEALTVDGANNKYHLIFSTDCSPFQHWQSYVVFYSALKVRQPGHVTRIASGCEGEEEEQINEWFQKHIAPMSLRFRLHLTPHFSAVKGENGKTVGDYKFFNKPFGLLHWLENGLGFAKSKEEIKKKDNEDVIVILIDPDQILLRPITGDFSNDRETVIGRDHKRNRAYKVEHGRPFAQKYGLGTQWQKFDLATIAGADSPARKVSREDGASFYPVGPPYLGYSKDMYQIALKWTEFVPKVHAEYPHLLAEMYAFCIAAAHLEMPHQLIDSLMISNTAAGGEGWPLVDAIPPEEVCEYAARPQHSSKYAVPSVVHFCQRYIVGDRWFFGKRKVPQDIFTCEHPLLEEPPMDVAVKYDYKMPPGSKIPEKKPLSQKAVSREAFMVCAATALMNEAALFFKQHNCVPGNMDRLNMYDLFKKD